MTTKKQKRQLAFLFIVIAFIVLLQQFVSWGIWFEIEDIHHETLAIALTTLAVGIFWGVKRD